MKKDNGSVDKRSININKRIDERNYWMNKLSGNLEKSSFPIDSRRRGQNKPVMEAAAFTLYGDLFSKLMRLCNESDIRLYIILMTGVVLLLEKYTGNKNIVVGAPIYKQEIEGDFINKILVLRNQLYDDKTFKELLLQVSQTNFEAVENSNYPLETIHYELNMSLPGDDFPLFDTVILLRNIHDKSYISHLNTGVVFSFFRTDACIEGSIEYDASLYNRGTIERIIRHFTNLMRIALANIDRKISDIPLLSENEFNQILGDSKGVRSGYPAESTLHELFQQQVEKTPLHTAVECGERRLTYIELNRKANQLGRLLRERGVEPETIVGILSDRSIEMIIGILAVLKAGGAYLPIDPEYPVGRINYFLNDSNIKLLLTGNNMVDKAAFTGTIMHLADDDLYRGEFSDPEPLSHPGSPAYVIYTSGTTGKPRGVMIEHQAVVNYVWWAAKTYVKKKNVNFPLYSSISFDLTVTSIFTPLVTGNAIVVYEREEKEFLIETVVKENKVGIVKLTPSHLHVIKHIRIEQSGIECFVVGGEEFKTQVAREFNDIYGGRIDIYNEYGPTETTVGCIFHKYDPGKDTGKVVPIGIPTDNSEIYILDHNQKVVPVGVKGEIYISGDGAARGYLNRPEITIENFVDNPFDQGKPMYKTGDLARWLPGGSIDFLGRIDKQVKIRGNRIELGEIEAHLLTHENIKKTVVIARENVEESDYAEEEHQYLCAYLVSDKELQVSQLREYLLENLPGYMVPSFFVQLEEMPLTSNGKIDMNMLPDPDIKTEQKYIPPRGEIEMKLVRVWSEVLKVEKERIGRDANFFELGGQSLKQVSMLSLINSEFDIEVPVAEIFNKPTIRTLSKYIKEATKVKHDSMEVVEEKEYYELSSAQKRLFFLDQLVNVGQSYNVPFFIKVIGQLDKERFKNAINSLVEKQESLRISFELIDNEPVQRIWGKIDFEIEEIQMSKKDTKEENIKKIIKEFIRPFDLTKAPLFRIGFAAFSEEEHLLLFDIHHIISDGYSMGIMYDDFRSAYIEEELSPLKIKYKDFSTWQNNLFNTGKIKRQEDYWLYLYSGEIPRINLPTDYPRPNFFSFEGDHYEFRLNYEDKIKFKEICSEYDVTLFMNLLTVFNILLYKYTGQDDIIIGSTFAGRPHFDLERIIGMFVNELAMRNHVDGKKTYTQFLKDVKENSVNAFENQDVQFEQLVDKLKLRRDTSRNPLFDVCLAVHPFEQKEMEIRDITFFPYKYENKTSKFDITLNVFDRDDEIFFDMEYCTSLFKKETIERFINHLLNIIKQVSERTGISISEISVLSKEEEEQLLYDFNKTTAAYPEDKTVNELIEVQVEKGPEKIAVVYENDFLTYYQLNERCNQLANYLYSAKHTRKEERVGILLDNSMNLIVSILGIQKAGGAYVPLDPSSPEDRIKIIVNNAEIKFVISQKKYIKTLNRLQWECKSLNTFLCVDSTGIDSENEEEKSELMDKKLWDYVGETASDEITGGGWITSDTGKPFTREEMDEYGDNILKKLRPLLHKDMRVLEIGCASGLSMYRIAPKVGFYYGTDLSSVIIEKNKKRVKEEGYQNIILACLPAHEIEIIKDNNFDLVIINSVIQSFHGHNYLKKVLRKAVDLSGERGYLFIGDVMDQDLKEDLTREMIEFKQANRGKGYTTKTDWSTELFISRAYFEDLKVDFTEITDIEFSHKIFTVQNELTKFRYDALITIDKRKKRKGITEKKHKYQEDIGVLEGYSTKQFPSKAKPHHLAYVIYTSGTTGRPKGVMVEHKSLVNYTWWGVKQYLEGEHSAFPLYTTASFDLTVTSIYVPLISGNTIHIYDNEKEKFPIQEVIKENAVDILKATPSHLKILRAVDIEGSRLKKFIIGGEELETKLARDVYNRFSRGVEIYNEYGPTEATVGCMIYKFDCNNKRRGVPIGLPIDNVKIYILDEYLNPVPIHAVGELYISGDALARGYLKQQRLTEEKFIKNPFLPGAKMYGTGDLARRLPDGNIEFCGRIDEQVKIRGYRIEIKEIENRLKTIDEINEAIVIAREDENGEKYLCAYFVPLDVDAAAFEKMIDSTYLREQLANDLPGYMIPSYFIRLEKIPLTVNGKVDMKALVIHEVEAGGEIISPRDDVEERLIGIWSSVLGIPKNTISIDANFFESGGHSLRAITLIALIHKEFDIKMPLIEVFKTTTVNGLAEYIKRVKKEVFVSVEQAEKKKYYNLSSAQKRLYIIQQIQLNDIGYNMPEILVLEGTLDKERLGESFKKLVKRHESLRTSFVEIEDEPVQMIHEEVPFAIECYDLLEGRSEEEIVRDFVRWFDLSKAPLLRVGLIKVDEAKHILMVDMHHIISDAVSHDILVQDLGLLYRGDELPGLKFQYKDYSEWQNREKTGKTLEQQESYWLDVFAGEIPFLNLPTDYERPAIRRADGDKLDFLIDKELTGKLTALVKEAGATTYMVLLAVYNILLSKYTGQEDIVVGSPISGRRHADLQTIIGMFVNMLAIRNFPGKEKTFAEFLIEVKKNALDAYENQEYQYEELVRTLGIQRNRSSNPLFDVVFAMQNVDVEPVNNNTPNSLNRLKMTPYEYAFRKAPFDLILGAVQLDETIVVNLVYSTALFKQSTTRKLAERFKSILTQVVENNHIKLKDITVMHQLLEAESGLLEESQSEFTF
jgi:amino acid adenylation domain-containing protein